MMVDYYSLYAIFEVNEQFNFSCIISDLLYCNIHVFPSSKNLSVKLSLLSSQPRAGTQHPHLRCSKCCNVNALSRNSRKKEGEKRKKDKPRKLEGSASYHDGKSYQKIFQNSLVHLHPQMSCLSPSIL